MTRTLKPMSGRRAIVLRQISAVTHALEAPLVGLGIAGGLFLVARKAGEIILFNRRGAPSGELVAPGVLLLLGVVLAAASLLFFHRKRRLLYQRLFAAAYAVAFFAGGYALYVRTNDEHVGKDSFLSFLLGPGAPSALWSALPRP